MARKIGVGASCLVSIGAGLGLVFKLITPESVAGLATPELMGLLALLVLPVAVLGALRAHRARPVMHAAATPQSDHPGDQPAQRVVVLAPDLRDRTARRHRHLAAVAAVAAQDRVRS